MKKILFLSAIAVVSFISFLGCDDENKIQNEKNDKPVSTDSIPASVSFEYVDLGLSVNWATFNVGATKPEEYGDYYAWGETETKTDYSWETYKWCNGSENTLTKYCNNSEYGYNGYTDDKYVLDPEDDVAQVKWGGAWRMPTGVEMGELIYNCSWTRDSINGIDGFKVTGPSGNSIFLPAAGYYSGTEWIKSERFEDNRDGDLWSSTPGDDYKSYFVYFLTGMPYRGVTQYDRYRGWSVRPVCPKETSNDGSNDNTRIRINYYGCEIFPGDHIDIDIYAENQLLPAEGWGVSTLTMNWKSAVCTIDSISYVLNATDGATFSDYWDNYNEYEIQSNYWWIWAFQNSIVESALLNASESNPVIITMIDLNGNRYELVFSEPQQGNKTYYQYHDNS